MDLEKLENAQMEPAKWPAQRTASMGPSALPVMN